MRIRINKRAVLTVLSAVSFLASGIHLWRNRKKIDAVLDETREDRHSEDKEVKKEANWTCVKKIAPIVAPVTVGMAIGIASACGVHAAAIEEMNQARATIDALSRTIANDRGAPDGMSIQEMDAHNLKEWEKTHNVIEYDSYYFCPTGETVKLRKGKANTELDLINDQILSDLKGDDSMFLGDIRRYLNLSGTTGCDELMEWKSSNPPRLKIGFPSEPHGDFGNELWWEIYIDTLPHNVRHYLDDCDDEY